MKNIFTLAALFFSISSFAAERPKPAKLAITSSDKSLIMVKIDGVMHNLDRNTFVMDNIRTGNHSITIYKTESFGFRKRTEVIYNNSLYISPAQFIDIDINRNGKVKMNKSMIDRFDRDDRFNGNGRDYNDRDHGGYNDNGRNNDDHFGRH
jgi:hypothetical protein